MGSRHQTWSLVVATAELISSLALLFFSLVALQFLGPSVFFGDAIHGGAGSSWYGLTLVFCLSVAVFCGGTLLHAATDNETGLLPAFAAMPFALLSAAFFVGSFGSWSAYFVPLLPLVVLTGFLAYFNSTAA